MISLRLPLRIQSEMNLREHWAKRASRAKLHRTTSFAELRLRDLERPIPRLLGPVVVRLIRIAPRKLDDDNLRAGFKATRDGIADWFGCPDNDPRIKWEYAQEKGKSKEYAARVEIMEE